MFNEALDVYGHFPSWFRTVALNSVGQAYVKSIEGAATGQIIIPV